ncbi:hypothetical protein C8Q75DRAFT_756110 [Abortiporus biennis]|nr:hypothetical protein C8Q75DRAFT_756110 [Abortiporus biennis]
MIAFCLRYFLPSLNRNGMAVSSLGSFHQIATCSLTGRCYSLAHVRWFERSKWKIRH